MLTSCKLKGNPAAISAYHTKEENYYFSQASGPDVPSQPDPARSHVRIHGKLAAQLGLTPGGEISQQAFTNILSGKDAAGNDRFVPGDRPAAFADRVFENARAS